jgi:hypothetical protein
MAMISRMSSIPIVNRPSIRVGVARISSGSEQSDVRHDLIDID